VIKFKNTICGDKDDNYKIGLALMHLFTGKDTTIKASSGKLTSSRWSDVRRYFSDPVKIVNLIKWLGSGESMEEVHVNRARKLLTEL
jgi:hypothetical protein